MFNHIYRIVSRHPLAGELTAALAVKILLLTLASIFLFGADQRIPIDKEIIAHHLFDQSPSYSAR